MKPSPALKNVKITQHGYVGTYRGLIMMATERQEDDGKMWMHASVSRQNGSLPDYEDLRQLKRICIGDDKTALQVFPPKDKHFSRKGVEVLHLWCCLDGDVTPDFRNRTLWGTMEI